MKSLLISVGVLYLFASCASLKCQTDDGITTENVKRIVRACVRKIGDNTYEDNDSRNESEEYDDEDNQDRQPRKHSKTEDDYYVQRNRDHYRNSQRSFHNGYYDDYDHNQGYSRNRGDRQRHQNVSLTDKQAEKDSACLIHCFFQEMRMTNDRQLPDKHKTIQVLTKDLRDKQLKEFYVNSIQECFYILELDHQQPGKCEFSNLLLQCLAERARTNCDDWDNRTILF